MQPSGLRDTTRLLPGLKAGVSDVEKSMKFGIAKMPSLNGGEFRKLNPAFMPERMSTESTISRH